MVDQHELCLGYVVNRTIYEQIRARSLATITTKYHKWSS
jgi:hypothetical protein